jgi:hypothetical protein
MYCPKNLATALPKLWLLLCFSQCCQQLCHSALLYAAALAAELVNSLLCYPSPTICTAVSIWELHAACRAQCAAAVAAAITAAAAAVAGVAEEVGLHLLHQ